MTKKAILYFFLFVTLSASAADPVKEALAKSGDASKYPGENQLTVFDSTLVDVQESGLTYVTVHTLTKVLTAKGAEDLAVVKFGYDPLSAWVEIRKAVIHGADGTITELDLSKSLDYPAPARAIYWGAREKMLGI